MADWNTNIIEEFRANEGRVGGYFEGASMLLLHTKGRRTGTERINPVVYLPDDERFVVFGTANGTPTDPDWIRNLEANPETTIDVGTETIPVRATAFLREGPEHDDLYARQVERRPGFADYIDMVKGHRQIPVVILERTA